MERKIGDTFEFEGRKLEVRADNRGCDGCFFDTKCLSENMKLSGECEADWRDDGKGVIFVEVQESQKLNLCEILKYCPAGEPLWSPMLGDVKLYDINQEAKMVDVELESGDTWDINADGTITFGNVTSQEIMLYPSKEQRDWTKVKYEKKKELPKTWEKFCEDNPRKKNEAYFDLCSKICIITQDYEYRDKYTDKNLLPSKQAVEAHLALMQLHQLRDAWREGWVPDWKDDTQSKYVILKFKGKFEIKEFYAASRFLTFQDEKRADEFKDCFIDLIKQAGDLI